MIIINNIHNISIRILELKWIIIINKIIGIIKVKDIGIIRCVLLILKLLDNLLFNNWL